MSSWPVLVVPGPTGRRLVAAHDLPVGTAVGRFEGPIVAPEDVPEGALVYALVLDTDRWLVPTTDARFADHACDPSCVVDDDLVIVTARPVAAGEPLTFRYDVVRDDEPDPGPWLDAWSFTCACGAPVCRGRVDGYVRG